MRQRYQLFVFAAFKAARIRAAGKPAGVVEIFTPEEGTGISHAGALRGGRRLFCGSRSKSTRLEAGPRAASVKAASIDVANGVVGTGAQRVAMTESQLSSMGQFVLGMHNPWCSANKCHRSAWFAMMEVKPAATGTYAGSTFIACVRWKHEKTRFAPGRY